MIWKEEYTFDKSLISTKSEWNYICWNRRQLKNKWMQSNMSLMINQVARLISNFDIYKGTFLKSTKYEDVDD